MAHKEFWPFSASSGTKAYKINLLNTIISEGEGC